MSSGRTLLFVSKVKGGLGPSEVKLEKLVNMMFQGRKHGNFILSM